MGNRSSENKNWMNFHGPNIGYVIDLYEKFLQDPNSIDPQIREQFEEYGPPELQNTIIEETGEKLVHTGELNIEKMLEAIRLVNDIRNNGHLESEIYPLMDRQETDFLNDKIKQFQLSIQDLHSIPATVWTNYKNAPFHNGYDVIKHLFKVYCGTTAYEFNQVTNSEEKAWLQKNVELGTFSVPLSKKEKRSLLKRLSEVDGFEKFLHKTFVGQKRFSIEGLDSLVPLLDALVDHSVQNGTKVINIGMAHRGRLNVLAHILGKPYERIFSEFQHAPNKELVPSEGSIGINFGWSGDVKYHLGSDRKITEENTEKCRITLANNPSHLEFVGPIVEGFTRAAQDKRDQPGYAIQDKSLSMAVLIHGDAAFPGQGIVAETLNLSRLNGYNTGGTIHIIANNTIGFTTESTDSRSTMYASDLAKGFEIPIVHVNADDPEAVLSATRLAFQYRAMFNKDFLIDLIGFRRFGHNEMDEPRTTNPLMYKKIDQHPGVKALYYKKLEQENVLSMEEFKLMEDEIQTKLKSSYENIDAKENEKNFTLPITMEKGYPMIETKVSWEQLKQFNEELLQWPTSFKPLTKLERILKRRSDVFTNGGKIDWAHAEMLAFASILNDKVPVRFTGQDSERGTFAHRHLVLHDDKTGQKLSPLHSFSGAKASFTIYNSPLSEAAVLGFEYGYNIYSEDSLVIWEAQYGDFANTAQVMFDQFIAAGRAKWGQKSGLVMLLPHGYEGQGPEHSSARMERFLQLAADNNWIVANVSNAAQYFHILRRQAAVLQKDEVRPLVIMSPKSLLRNPNVAVDATQLCDSEFKSILEEPITGQNPEKVERLILASGKITIDLTQQLQKNDDHDWLHIVRVEELYPFPQQELTAIFSLYKNIKEIVWVQEEPQNMGAWTYMEPRIKEIAPKGIPVSYIGRQRRASTAEGDPHVHKNEQERIIVTSLTKTMKEEA